MIQAGNQAHEATVMTATVTKLKVAKRTVDKSTVTKATKLPSKQAIRAAQTRRLATYAVGAVALTLTGLSLSHLTCGIAEVTGGSTLDSGAMAVGIDLGFVALEVAQIVDYQAVKRFTQPAIIGTMLASAALNAFGFAAHAQGLMMYPAALLGCAIPALIYAMTRAAVALTK